MIDTTRTAIHVFTAEAAGPNEGIFALFLASRERRAVLCVLMVHTCM